MLNIPFKVIEDQDINVDLIQKCLNESGSEEYNFFYDMDFPLVRISINQTALEIYKEVIRKMESLNGPQILSFDLGLGIDNEKLEALLDGDKAWKQLKDLMEATGTVNYFYNEKGYHQGLYLVFKALTNNNWYGMILMCSALGNQVFDDIMPAISSAVNNKRVHIDIKTSSMYLMSNIGQDEKGRLKRFQLEIKQITDDFIRRFGTIEERLWPNFAREWFPIEGKEHNPPTHSDAVKWREWTLNIKQYLRNLLFFDPPEHWFSENEFGNLYHDLKGLIGLTSVFKGKGTYGLTIGNVLLLLAEADEKSNSTKWIENIHWTNNLSHAQILPKNQDKDDAKKAILDLRKFFEQIIRHKTTKKPLIAKVFLQVDKSKPRLMITLNLSLGEDVKKELSDLSKGDARRALQEFLCSAGKTTRGKESKCVINLYSETTEETTLEIIPC